MVCFDCTPTWTRVLVHTHETGPWPYPVPNLNLNLIPLEQTYSTCARTPDPRTKQQTKQTINLDDAEPWTPLDPKQNTTTNSADKHPERLLTRTNCKQTPTWTSTSVSTTRWGWSQRLTQHICGHTSFQTDYKHLGDNLWRFQRRGSPIPQQTWPSELTCSSQINLKQWVTAGAPYGAQWHMWPLSVVPPPCGASTPNSTALNLWTGAGWPTHCAGLPK